MVKLTSLLALSTLIIAPTFASDLWDLETRDVIEDPVFARDTNGLLFVREQDSDLAPHFGVNLRRIANAVDAARKIGLSALFGHATPPSVPVPQYTAQDLLPHPPPDRHQFVDRDLDDELLERDLDRELYIRALADDDLFVRFYDDLD